MGRTLPNILVLGTPGTGKSTLVQALVEKTGLKPVTLSEVIKAEKLYKEWDDEYNAAIFDEDATADYLDNVLSDGGIILEFHSCEWMDPDWFDLIVILHADTKTLYDRLEKRGYPLAKVQENVQAEIFMICKEEAWNLVEDINGHGMIVEFDSDTFEQIEQNVEAICQNLKSRGF